jgi:HEAT repeat protein
MGRVAAMGVPGSMVMLESGDYDTETMVKIEALYALGEIQESPESFEMLKEVALDRKQPEVLRVTAIETLSDFRKYDPMPVFIEIAKRDTSERLRMFALEYIGSSAKDKEKAFDAIMQLYKDIPSTEPDKRRIIFYSLAETGSPRAVDFLAEVATSSEDAELRREAVFYLGNIGGEKARTALYKIIRGK